MTASSLPLEPTGAGDRDGVPAPDLFGGRPWLPVLIVFVSNVCIMVLELVAGRIIAPYVGVSLYTWTSVIGVVLAGISLGNYLGGRLADRWASARLAGRRFSAGGPAQRGHPRGRHVWGCNCRIVGRSCPHPGFHRGALLPAGHGAGHGFADCGQAGRARSGEDGQHGGAHLWPRARWAVSRAPLPPASS